MKVTHRLAQAGWLETLRGRGGGMRLAKPANQISLGKIVRDMESDFEIVECFGRPQSCALDGQCKLAGVMGGALDAFLFKLDEFTLNDVLPKPATSVVPLLRHKPKR